MSSIPSITIPTVIADYHCVCGEGPLYDARRNVLFWTDIDSGKLFRYDLATKSHRQIYSGDQVGGFTLQENGDLLLFREKDIVQFEPDSGKQTKVRDVSDEGSTRFNDTQASPRGGCFAGTIGKSSESGGLFLLTTDNQFSALHRGTGCSNGIAWSPDRRTMYWQCSSKRKTVAYDYDEATDAIRNPRILYTATAPEEGTPDGMAVDSLGNIYSARWGGSGIYIHSPEGQILHKITLPPKQVSSLCFGGHDLCDMFITTAGRGDPTPGAGALYHCRTTVPGLAQFRSKIALPTAT